MAQTLENIKDASKNHKLQAKLSLLFKKSVVDKFCRKRKIKVFKKEILLEVYICTQDLYKK